MSQKKKIVNNSYLCHNQIKYITKGEENELFFNYTEINRPLENDSKTNGCTVDITVVKDSNIFARKFL